MSEPSQEPDPALLARLRARRKLAAMALLFERVWPVLWPPIGVLGAYVCFALLDLPALLTPWLRLVLAVAVAAAVVALLMRGLRGVARPAAAEADRRLERASGLRHRPLQILGDAPAAADEASVAIWRVHVARALAQVDRLRIGVPRPGLAARDRRALRGGLVVALAACIGIAGADGPRRLLAAVTPTLPQAAAAPETQIQAWITPPAYTGLAPVFLKPEGGAVSVPAGAKLTINVTGGAGDPALETGGHADTFRKLDAASWQADRDLTAGGRVTIRRGTTPLASWEISLVADRAPVVTWTEAPGRAARSLQTRLPWTVAHDYGVASLQAELRLRDRPDAAPVQLGIPLSGGAPKAAHGVNLQDLTAHPWAGLPVVARLVARDATGLAGTSADAEFVLPERPFQNPLARALLAVRRDMSLRPDDRRTPVGALTKLLEAPDGFGSDMAAVLNLGAIVAMLRYEPGEAAVPEAQARLWSLALHLEEGQTERTARALEEARQAAREATDRATADPSEKNRADLEAKLRALEQAVREHMQALAEQAKRDGSELPNDPQADRLTERDIQRRAEEAEQAAREGRMDEAQRKMAELEQLLDQMKMARTDHAKGDNQAQERRQRGREQMGALQDMIAREGGLADHAQARAGGGQLDPLTGRPVPAPPPSDDAPEARAGDGRVQQALRRALGELMQQYGDLAGSIPSSLSDADTAMRDAVQALGAGRDAAALAAEQRAIAALQQSGRDMSQQMSRQMGNQPGDDQAGDEQDGEGQRQGMGTQDDRSEDGSGPGGPRSGQHAQRRDRRDPLGRQMGQGASGADEGDDVRVPEEMERQRTRAIQDELRRRGADRSRPQQELDYIDRLLRQF